MNTENSHLSKYKNKFSPHPVYNTIFLHYIANFSYEYRLVDGSSPYKGRLEVRRNEGTWGTVYGTSWTSRHASVACRSLGFSSSVLPPNVWRRDGYIEEPVHSVITRCDGDETSLFECTHFPWDDSEYIDNHCCDVRLSCMPGKWSF